MKISLILFDFDFTLVDASGCLFKALREGLGAIGIEFIPEDKLKPLIGISLEQQFRILTNLNPQQTKKFLEFKSVYVATRDATELRGSHLLPGVIETLATLKVKGLNLGIVSTGAPGRIRRTLKHFDVVSYFGDNVFGGAADKADVILKAVNHFNLQLKETIYVGDRPDDGQAAQSAGVGFVGITSGAFVLDDFPKETTVISSLSELVELY